MKYKLLTGAAFLAASMTAMPIAQAGEVSIGVFAHDVEISGIGGAKGKEKGQAIALEYRFDSPDIFEAIWSPKPYVYATGNLNGNTSHAGAGLAWQKGFSEAWYGEFAFGLSGHNGEERVPNPADTVTDRPDLSGTALQDEIARRRARKDDTIEFGSTLLFRIQLALGYQLSDEWATELVYEHLSNGRIIGGPENEGVDNIGLRLAYKY